jgi:hypothetical protein
MQEEFIELLNTVTAHVTLTELAASAAVTVGEVVSWMQGTNLPSEQMMKYLIHWMKFKIKD